MLAKNRILSLSNDLNLFQTNMTLNLKSIKNNVWEEVS